MAESLDPKMTEKPPVRCDECDRVSEHYNEFLGPDNVVRAVCWECTQRSEKGFFAKRDFRRGSRSGYIPR